MEQLTNWRTVVGLAIYGGSALLYILALRRIPLTVALPCTALSYLAVALVGHFAFNEAFSLQRGIALARISAGGLVLATSRCPPAQPPTRGGDQALPPQHPLL